MADNQNSPSGTPRVFDTELTTARFLDPAYRQAPTTEAAAHPTPTEGLPNPAAGGTRRKDTPLPGSQILPQFYRGAGLLAAGDPVCASAPRDGPPRVLIVESRPGGIRPLCQRAAQAPTPLLVLKSADSLAAALECLAEQPMDVILLDLKLPDGQGLNAFLQARAQVGHVPIVVIVDADQETLAQEAVAEGAQDFLLRGQVDDALLRRCLRYAINGYQMRAALDGLSLDFLTGLYNRHGFRLLAEHQLKLLHRSRGLLLVFVSLEGLRQINQRFGHLEGNRALLRTARILRHTFRASDIVARLAVDEFAALAIDISEASAADLTQRLDRKLAEYNAQAQGCYPLVLTTGAAWSEATSKVCLTKLVAQANAVRKRLPQ